MIFADHTLRLGRQSLAVLAFLHDEHVHVPEGRQIRSETWAWYNGRERGVGFTLYEPVGPAEDDFGKLDAVHIVIYEHKNGDSIEADLWYGVTDCNPPTVEDRKNIAHEFSVPRGEVARMADWIIKQLQAWIDAYGRWVIRGLTGVDIGTTAARTEAEALARWARLPGVKSAVGRKAVRIPAK